MPVVATSAYNTAEDVLVRLRTIMNDSEVEGGDVLTDSAPFTFDLLNSAFERVQLELAKVGVEVAVETAWLIGLPSMPTVDPEARLVLDDDGTHVVYPNGVGNADYDSPQLPTDLVMPLKLWERQTATTTFPDEMRQPNGGLSEMNQQNFLVDWEWQTDEIRFRGALQSQDVKIKYERALLKLIAPTDHVPIRGVVNAAAYFAAYRFAQSRGGMIAPQFKQEAMDEIFLLQQLSTRRRQRKQVRRKPYSGSGGRGHIFL